MTKIRDITALCFALSKIIKEGIANLSNQTELIVARQTRIIMSCFAMAEWDKWFSMCWQMVL
jgi:hypothetical protein